MMSASPLLFMDGTFKAAPRLRPVVQHSCTVPGLLSSGEQDEGHLPRRLRHPEGGDGNSWPRAEPADNYVRF